MSRTLSNLQRHFDRGIFTVPEAATVGITRSQVRYAFEAGLLQRVARGKYRIAAAPGNPRARYLERLDAILHARPGAALAGVSAAAAWGLSCPDPWGDWTKLPTVLCTDRRVHPRPGVIQLARRHRTLTEVGGYLATDLVDTAVDVACHLPVPEALIVVDDVARRLTGTSDRRLLITERARQTTRARLTGALTSRKHSTRARHTLSWADPAAESPPESYARAHILLAELPPPLVNHPVQGLSGRTYFADLYWPAQRRVVEIDGKLKYSDAEIVYREKLRQDDIQAAGNLVTRWVAADVFAHAPLLVADLAALL